MSTQMFLVMDSTVLPEHLKQTFKLVQGAGGKWSCDMAGLDVASLGQEIDLYAEGYAILYADNLWHRDRAAELYDQIRGLKHDAMILELPVEVEANEQVSKLVASIYDMSLPSGSMPPINWNPLSIP